MGTAGHCHHAARDVRQEQIGERKVLEVVDAELQLEPVLRMTERRNKNARVVDEQMDVAGSLLRELTH